MADTGAHMVIGYLAEIILFGIVANLLNKWYIILAAHHNLLGNF